MKLISFTIQNFRSITTAYKIRIAQTAVLIGPNNEGKSNILRAVVAAMKVLTGGMTYSSTLKKLIPIGRCRFREWYDWDRDFPVKLQQSHPNGKSFVTLEFELDVVEIAQFQLDVGSSLNGTLPIRVEFSKDGQPVIRVAKQGKGGKALTQKSAKVAQFLASRLDLEHIPAIRTAESAQRLVDEMVQRQLAQLENDADYKDALQRIADMQRPVLDQLATSIQGTLKKFLPRVQTVSLNVVEEGRYAAMRRDCEIVVDDGSPTQLKYKGDGVQSLAALGIMRHASAQRDKVLNVVVAVEEPESHLHPRAIHELRDVLSELSSKHQVIISTHCPLFVDRTEIKRNIIVRDNKAHPAKNIQEIRDTLGVRAADNLRHAEVILVVEGEGDKEVLKSLLREKSARLRVALENNTLGIDTLAGGTNLAYKLSLLRDSLVLYKCFLDNDKAGQEAFQKARDEGLLDSADVTFAICDGMLESEIEDHYSQSAYLAMVKNAYAVDLTIAKFRSNKKWSVRMSEAFKGQGKLWNEQVEKELKWRVAQAIMTNPGAALDANRQGPIDALVKTLEESLDNVKRNE